MTDATVNVLLSGFSHLLVSQISTRLITFVLNLLVARLLSPEVYGLAAVQFHLINTTILFLSREGIRRGCLRIKQDDPRGTARVVALSGVCVALGLPITLAVCTLACGWAHDSEAGNVHTTAVAIQGLAAMVELVSEPLYLLATHRLLFRLRAAVDTAAMLLKCAGLLLLLRYSRLPPALALSWAQVAYAAVLLLGYAAHFIGAAAGSSSSRAAQQCAEDGGGKRSRTGQAEGGVKQQHEGGKPQADAVTEGGVEQTSRTNQHLHRRQPQAVSQTSSTQAATTNVSPKGSGPADGTGPLLDAPLLWLCGIFSVQAGEKLVLAEGSKMAMVAAQSSYNQGVYGLVANLGSLVVRTLFQPLEEAAFTAFSKSGGERGSGQQAALLAVLVRFVTMVGLLAAAFGPAYSYVLLRVAYGPRWAETQAPLVLAVYSAYIALLAANGILEAFVHAVADSRQLTRINSWLVLFAAAHLGLSLALVGAAGAVGLVVADGINMALRIAYCLSFVRSHFHGVQALSLRAFFPAQATMGILCTSAVITGSSAVVCLQPVFFTSIWKSIDLFGLERLGLWPRMALHVSVGVACLGAVAATIYRVERTTWQELKHLNR